MKRLPPVPPLSILGFGSALLRSFDPISARRSVYSPGLQACQLLSLYHVRRLWQPEESSPVFLSLPLSPSLSQGARGIRVAGDTAWWAACLQASMCRVSRMKTLRQSVQRAFIFTCSFFFARCLLTIFRAEVASETHAGQDGWHLHMRLGISMHCSFSTSNF